MANQLGQIQHIVQLMLENRSFDQMLGYLYAKTGNKSPLGHPFDGLTGNESNLDDQGRLVKVYPIPADNPNCYLTPGADPGEGFLNTNYQLFLTDDPPPNAVATNQGFVKNFKSAIATDVSKHYSDTLPGTDASQIMGMYTPDLLPVLSGLASGYAVCDRWFSSAPTQTFPNRWFAGAGTSQGYLHNVKRLVLTAPSIFGRLSTKGVDWAIYGYSSEPLTRHDFTDIQTASENHFGHFRDFQTRAQAGTLPAYSFLEPSWGADGNSQHPNYDVAKGEQLIHDVYYAVRNGPGWNSTLLIITYDEHGGNFDHVPPAENATPPGDGTVGEHGFDFKRFGVRVPAVLVSPLIAKGTVFRSNGPIDHTSVLKTIQMRFQTTRLTDRVEAAAGLGDVLTIAPAKVRTDDPLAGVVVPDSSGTHPNASTPSQIEEIHAERVAALPIRNHNGYYEHEEPVTGSTSDLNNFIRDRTAAWKEHQRRLQVRRAHLAVRPPTAQKSRKKTARHK